ncbi:MAG: hypothetical protein ACJA2F_001363 [Nitriliruptoraceae bacterium]|jgi:hypothetical protein
MTGVTIEIAILITTYRRNVALLRVLQQVISLAESYTGPHRYRIVIADSDHENPEADQLAALPVTYVVNTGVSFDENVLTFYDRYGLEFDWVLHLSDDDLFLAGSGHPFASIDAALTTNADAILFNHRDFHTDGDGGVRVGDVYYTDVTTQMHARALAHKVVGSIPRHTGMLLQPQHVFRLLAAGTLEPFVGTGHLYAAPLVLAAVVGRASFVDLPLTLFHAQGDGGGAWEDLDEVFMGLVQYATVMRQALAPDAYAHLYASFMASYFAQGSWLRSMATSVPTTPQLSVLLGPSHP